MPRLSHIVDTLPDSIPFVGPEALERRFGRTFRARIGANESLFGASPLAIQAMADSAASAHLYGDPEGIELRDRLAAGLGLTRDHIVLGSGIDELLGLVVRAWLDPGDVVVMSTGGYPTFIYHVTGYGGRIAPVPYNDFRNDPAALAKAAREQGARIVYLSNPDNPTGSWLSTGDLRQLVAGLPADCLLILDEAYSEFLPPSDLLEPIEDPRLVRMRTFSKAHGLAGVRIGYVFGAPETVRPLDRIRNHFGISILAQSAALAALSDPDHVRRVVAETAIGRAELMELAAGIGIPALPSATNFLAFDLGTASRAAAALTALLEEEAIFVRRPGIAPLDRLVRVTIGPEPVRKIFADAFQRVVAKL